MARSVADAATLLSVIAGQDEHDNYTLAQPSVLPDYTLALKADGLKGVRLGVPRKRFAKISDDVMVVFNASLDVMRGLGATVVDPADLVNHEEFETYRRPNETLVTGTDLKVCFNSGQTPRTIIAQIHTSCRSTSIDISPGFLKCRAA